MFKPKPAFVCPPVAQEKTASDLTTEGGIPDANQQDNPQDPHDMMENNTSARTVHERETGDKCPPQYAHYAKLNRYQILDGYRDALNQIRSLTTLLAQTRNNVGQLRKQLREVRHIEAAMKALELQGKKHS